MAVPVNHGGLAARIGAAILLFAAASSAGGEESGFEFDIPYVPTPPWVVERMLALAEVSANDFVLDLGSGDGRIVIAAAAQRGARGLGVDINADLVRAATQNAEAAGVADRVTFREQDLFRTPLSEASVVTLYLPTLINLKLRPRLLEELRPGTRIVSHAFGMGAWPPDRQESVRGTDIFLWIVPAKVAGEWAVTAGDRRFTLTLRQRFQDLFGEAVVDGRPITLGHARLRGDELEFALDLGAPQLTLFRGKVTGNRMQSADPAAAWYAIRSAPQSSGASEASSR